MDYHIASPMPDEYCNKSFVPKFHPAHFTCLSCDTTTCEGCNSVMCDLSKCIGKFYEQECWCRAQSDVEAELPMWTRRKSDGVETLSRTISRYFCDDDCSGNMCDTPGLVCRRAQDACRPWWWCNGVPPPKTDSLKENAAFKSFLQRKDSHGRRKNSRDGAVASAQQLQHRVLQAQAAKGGKEVNSIADFSFKPSRYVCNSAALPPKVQDKKTFVYTEPGYIVFDITSCEGGEFEMKCICWDQFAYLRGDDPKASATFCDATCSYGGCDGKHCGTQAPPPITAPAPPPPPDAFVTESKEQLNNLGQAAMRLIKD